MMFANDRQRKAVMAQYSKWDSDAKSIMEKSFVPVSVRAGSDDEVTLKKNYDKMLNDLRKEEEKIMRNAMDDKIVFSEKRGSVPLLDTTFVIRGGTPKERQVVKKLLDAIGSETAMADFNTIRIEPDLKEQFLIVPEAKSLSVRSSDLHVKVGDFPIDLAMSVLANAMVLKNAAISDEVALDRAKETITLYLADTQHKERIKREKESIEVYQIDADRQPNFEVSDVSGPVSTPVEVKLVQESPADIKPDERVGRPSFMESTDMMLGV